VVNWVSGNRTLVVRTFSCVSGGHELELAFLILTFFIIDLSCDLLLVFPCYQVSCWLCVSASVLDGRQVFGRLSIAMSVVKGLVTISSSNNRLSCLNEFSARSYARKAVAVSVWVLSVITLLLGCKAPSTGLPGHVFF